MHFKISLSKHFPSHLQPHMLEIARILIAINLCVNVIFLLIFFSVLLRGVVCCNLTVMIEQICTTVSRFVYCNIANSVYIRCIPVFYL